MSAPQLLDLEQVLLALNTQMKYRDGGRKAYAVCQEPGCTNPHNPKYKVGIDFVKGTGRCNKCGYSFNAITRWADARGFQRTEEGLKEAARDGRLYFFGDEKPSFAPAPRPKVFSPSLESELAPLSQRDAVYSALLNLLSLSSEHKKLLLKKGLSEKAISENGYRSYPLSRLDKLGELISQQGLNAEGVPGFYVPEGKDKPALRELSQGILIPQRSVIGRIQGFQIRTSGKTRYMSLSTADMKKGAAAKTFTHTRQGKKGFRSVILTEGPLKGDIISDRTGYSVIAVPGVNSVSYLPQTLTALRKKGLEEVLIAFDMDAHENVHVEKALNNLRRLLGLMCIPYSTLEWSREFKGLDDFLVGINT